MNDVFTINADVIIIIIIIIIIKKGKSTENKINANNKYKDIQNQAIKQSSNQSITQSHEMHRCTLAVLVAKLAIEHGILFSLAQCRYKILKDLIKEILSLIDPAGPNIP